MIFLKLFSGFRSNSFSFQHNVCAPNEEERRLSRSESEKNGGAAIRLDKKNHSTLIDRFGFQTNYLPLVTVFFLIINYVSSVLMFFKWGFYSLFIMNCRIIFTSLFS